MNLFYLDDDLDKCAEFHVDKHVGKMQLEAVQLLSTALWVDKYIGYVPRALESDEWAVIQKVKSAEPDIDERTFTRYLPCHHNHPSAIWLRSSLEHFYWTINYVNALEAERQYRKRRPAHASSIECNRLPEPKHLLDKGFSAPTPAMPDELKSGDTILDYRLFYMLDKATFATWNGRGKPEWWDEEVAMYDRRYTGLTPAERRDRIPKMTYSDYYKRQSALQDVLPSKRDITSDLPDMVATELLKIRVMILGCLAELNEEGWEDDND